MRRLNEVRPPFLLHPQGDQSCNGRRLQHVEETFAQESSGLGGARLINHYTGQKLVEVQVFCHPKQ